MKAKVLIVEDDPRTASSLALYLRHGGYDVTTAATGPEALERAASGRPDLLVLDVMLPGVDGLEVCRTLRRHTNMAIIMLSARSTEDDKLEGLAAGADDYVTKPFSPRELVARVAAVLRRARPPATSLRVGGLDVDLLGRVVRRAGRPIPVTPAEFKILEALATNPARAFTRAELAARAFGHDHEALDRTIDVHIMNLRRKVEPDRARPTVVVTVFGTGYRLGDVEPAEDA